MRAYLDTNIYVSYLLNPLSTSSPATIVTAGLSEAFTILFGTPTLRELLDKVASKPYLKSRIVAEDVDDFLYLLHIAGERVMNAPEVIPAVTRDRKDDYLIAYSVSGRADYLVSGDPDLLVLKAFEGVRIVSPAEFVQLLDL